MSSSSESKLKAEARRRRILEQSQARIGVVSGEAVPVQAADHPVPIATETTLPSEGGLTEASAEDPAATETQQAGTVSGLSRYAQARRKRFASKKEHGTEEDPKIVTTDVTPETDVVPLTEEGHECNTETKQEVVQPVVVESSDTDADKQTNKNDTKEKEGEASTAEPVPVQTDKKYMGVAKMRRKLLAEQKAASTDAETTTNAVPVSASRMDKTTRRGWMHQIPFLVHLLTVCMLFLSGFHVGWDNHPSFQSNPTMSIHRKSSIMENGIGILSLRDKARSMMTRQNKRNGDTTMGVSTQDPYQTSSDIQTEEEEFTSEDSIKPLGVDSQSSHNKQANIDPLFRVDLDELTAGKSGFFFIAARAAISIHRFFLFLFWTYPYTFIRSILTKPFGPPVPIFFLYAIIIRFAAKYLLGMTSEPNLTEIWEKAYHGGDKKDTTSSSSSSSGIILEGSDRSKASNFVVPDIISVGKNFVYNMIHSNFPILTMAFGILREARSDMFVILCGFFLGIAFPLHWWGGSTIELVQSSSSSDEL